MKEEKSVVVEATVAPLAAGDAETIAALAREIWYVHYPAIVSAAQIEYMLGQRYELQVIRDELRRTDLWWDKLLAGSVIVGFSSYFLTEARAMKLDKLYVHQSHQRKGYGGMLIERALSTAREQGCSTLTLAVNKNNRSAIAAYRKHGFHVADSVVKDIGGGFVMDDYIMIRNI